MDVLFVIVAQLLLVPLVLWALLAIELSLGLISSVVAVLLGRRSAKEAVRNRLRSVVRRIVVLMVVSTTALLAADLLFFEALVSLALGGLDDREDLELRYANAEGSFILGRVELHGLELAGARGSHEGGPASTFTLAAETLVIDVDTLGMLTLDFAVEELSLDGVEGRYERFAPRVQADDEAGFELDREFTVERFHVGAAHFVYVDHDEADRTVHANLTELDAGPVRSEAPIFDLLYRTRGHGELRFGSDADAAALPFSLSTASPDANPRSTLELTAVPLDPFTHVVEARTGLRASGQAAVVLGNRYVDAPESSAEGPKIELSLEAKLAGLQLSAGDSAGLAAKVMLEVAEHALVRLGGALTLDVQLVILERELVGMRSLAESDLVDRLVQASVDTLQTQLRARDEG